MRTFPTLQTVELSAEAVVASNGDDGDDNAAICMTLAVCCSYSSLDMRLRLNMLIAAKTERGQSSSFASAPEVSVFCKRLRHLDSSIPRKTASPETLMIALSSTAASSLQEVRSSLEAIVDRSRASMPPASSVIEMLSDIELPSVDKLEPISAPPLPFSCVFPDALPPLLISSARPELSGRLSGPSPATCFADSAVLPLLLSALASEL
mmetsp:Transcript_11396/g.28919  ORF Transcript_11396/g.28919 Transcript_11396/m.28919 type:complete len:208 (-) Transcript_11396:889-1512(-)